MSCNQLRLQFHKEIYASTKNRVLWRMFSVFMGTISNSNSNHTTHIIGCPSFGSGFSRRFNVRKLVLHNSIVFMYCFYFLALALGVVMLTQDVVFLLFVFGAIFAIGFAAWYGDKTDDSSRKYK